MGLMYSLCVYNEPTTTDVQRCTPSLAKVDGTAGAPPNIQGTQNRAEHVQRLSMSPGIGDFALCANIPKRGRLTS